MALYTRRVRVRKSRNGRIRKTYGAWNKQARLFNRSRSETSVSRTIFKTTKSYIHAAHNYGGENDMRKSCVYHIGSAGILFQDARWNMFKSQFDEFRIVGVKYVITAFADERKPCILLTSFDRSAAITADYERYITYQEINDAADTVSATDLCLTNPSCRETMGYESALNTQVISIFPVTPMEKQWIGTAFVRGRADEPQIAPTFMSAFNPRLTICGLLVGRTEQAQRINFNISTELYLETRGSKMKRE